MYLSLLHYLVLSGIVFFISIIGIIISRKNLISLLMCVELLLLSVNTAFVAISHALGDISGQIFVLFILSVAAAETAIGLAIFVLIYRKRSTIDLSNLDFLKG